MHSAPAATASAHGSTRLHLTHSGLRVGSRPTLLANAARWFGLVHTTACAMHSTAMPASTPAVIAQPGCTLLANMSGVGRTAAMLLGGDQELKAQLPRGTHDTAYTNRLCKDPSTPQMDPWQTTVARSDGGTSARAKIV